MKILHKTWQMQLNAEMCSRTGAGRTVFVCCLQNMFDGLKRDHHLKHTGRQQLGNFLKVSSPGNETCQLFEMTPCTALLCNVGSTNDCSKKASQCKRPPKLVSALHGTTHAVH